MGIFIAGKEAKSKIQTTFSKPEKYDYQATVKNIKNFNPFNIQEDETKVVTKKAPKKVKNEVKVCLEASARSSLNIKLINTIVLQNSRKSIAAVSKGGKNLTYRAGDRIGPDAEIGLIERKRMIFKNLKNGECEYIENVDKKALAFSEKANTKILPAGSKKNTPNLDGIKMEGNNFTIKKKLRDDLLGNIGDVLTQARAITIKNPDGSLCFKMTEVKPGSIYSHLNVQNDDVICEINGDKINSINQMMGMFGKIKSTNNYELGIKRNGTQQTYNYNFTD